MLSRCRPSGRNAHRYHQRGITVCERWRKFENFLADMGERPGREREYTIERKDNERGYEPGNCIWATWKTQAKNRAPNDNERNPSAKLTNEQVAAIRSDTRTQREISLAYGISQGHISRIKRRQQRV